MLPEGYQYQDEGLRRAQAKGKAAGKAEGVLAVLDARGLPVSAEQRARILGCTDTAELDRWLRSAVTAGNVDDLFTH